MLIWVLPIHIFLYLRCGLIAFVSAVVVITILYAVVIAVVVNNVFHDDFHTHASLSLTLRHKPSHQLPFVSSIVSVLYLFVAWEYFFSLNNKNAGEFYCLINLFCLFVFCWFVCLFVCLFLIIVCFDSVFHEKKSWEGLVNQSSGAVWKLRWPSWAPRP